MALIKSGRGEQATRGMSTSARKSMLLLVFKLHNGDLKRSIRDPM